MMHHKGVDTSVISRPQMNFHCGNFTDFVAFTGQLGVVMWPLNISNWYFSQPESPHKARAL